MEFSEFGRKLTSSSGILRLMDDLGDAMAAGGRDTLMLGGGNPGHIPAVQERFRARMQRILESDGQFEDMIGNYDNPQGDKAFIEALVGLLNKEFRWDISPRNIVLTNGSQTAFFLIFNMFAGRFADGTEKKILLPLTPEYIGYADVGLTDDFFVSSRPDFEFIDNHTFKYHVKFDSISVTDEIGAMCVSRPTNPTGNVLTDSEIEHLCRLADENDIPLIIDNAYGTPFPHIIFTDAKPFFNEHTIVCMSLSKIGLPTARTGIVIANEKIVEAVSAMNAIIGLAPGGFGASLALDMVSTGEILRLSEDVVMPFYQTKVERAAAQFRKELDGVDFLMHKPEGALFIWLWFRDFPITTEDLYDRLKKRNTLVVPGHYFFPGMKEDWRHKHECIRVTYSQDDEAVSAGIKVIAEEVRKAYESR
jgi:valine--pyruvate aminotransferase